MIELNDFSLKSDLLAMKMLDINSIKKASVCLESCHCASFAKELNLDKVLKFVILNFMLSGLEHCNKLNLYKKNNEKREASGK